MSPRFGDPDEEDALVNALAITNTSIQRIFNLLVDTSDGPVDKRLYGVRSRMTPPQDLINSRTFLYKIIRLTKSAHLKKVCEVHLEELNLHTDTYRRWPLSNTTLEEMYAKPTMEQLEFDLKTSAIAAEKKKKKPRKDDN